MACCQRELRHFLRIGGVRPSCDSTDVISQAALAARLSCGALGGVVALVRRLNNLGGNTSKPRRESTNAVACAPLSSYQSNSARPRRANDLSRDRSAPYRSPRAWWRKWRLAELRENSRDACWPRNIVCQAAQSG